MSDSNRGYRLAIVGALAALTFVTLGAGAYFGALYAPHYGYQSAHPTYRGPQPKQSNVSQIDRDRAGLPYFAERVASGPDPQDGSEREKRDLAAQESMSVWAFWLLLVSAIGTATTMIGTGFLLWQIILTRKAVRDTGDATEAMIEANNIARTAQRPWLQFKPKITQIEITETGLKLRYEAKVTNIGKMVADRCACRGGIIQDDGESAALRRIANYRDEAEKMALTTGDGPRLPYPIVPGETKTMAGELDHSGDLTGYQLADGTRRTNFIVFLCARYFVPGDDEMKILDRAFSVDYAKDGAEAIDPFMPYGIPIPLPSDLSSEQIILRPGGHNKTT